MKLWEYSLTMEQFLLDFAILGLLLLVATLARRYIKFFQHFLIPNSLIAGFLALLFGPELIDLLAINPDRMGVYIYHLLAILFIAVGLQNNPDSQSKNGLTLGYIQVMILLIQAIIGLTIALIFVLTIAPKLMPAAGLLLPLGFGAGPGVALSIGQSWQIYGFDGAGSVGLSIAAIGFLVAYFSGIIIVNKGIKKGLSDQIKSSDLNEAIRTGLIKKQVDRQSGATLTFSAGAIEPLTYHFALIGAIFGLTWMASTGLSNILIANGLETEVPIVWSFHFITANLLATVVRLIMQKTKSYHYVDPGIMTRITGLSTDYLVTASIAAISLTVVSLYAPMILVMAISAGLMTWITIKWLINQMFTDYIFERYIGLYGQMTGTMSSALALVKVADPNYQTPVAQDLVIGGALALVFAFPLFAIINIPFTMYDGAIEGYFVVLGFIAAYLFILGLGGFVWMKVKKSKA